MQRIKIIILLSFTLLLAHVTSGQQFSDEYLKIQLKLGNGWNTWNYAGMTSHVLLPEGLSININFRQAFIGTPYDPDFFLDNLTVDKSGMVRPIAHTFDGTYTELLIQGWKGNDIRIQSATTNNDIIILVTPIKKSNTRFYIELESGSLWNREGHLSKKGETIVASISGKTFVIRSTGKPVQVAQPYTTPYLILEGDTTTALYTGKSRTLSEATSLIEAAKIHYDTYALKYGELAEGFKALQSVLGWNTIYDADKNRVITPVTRGWNEAWQGYVLFEWDTYFAALLFALDNKDLAYSNAIAMTKGQKNSAGLVGFTQWPYSKESTQSQPPIGAMACWLIYEKYKEKWFLEEVYNELLVWNKWWISNRLNKGYLTWGASWKGAELQHIMLESGLDNAPMYEDALIRTVGDNSLLNLADVGLNSLYVADCKYLAKMANVLGKKSDEKELVNRAQQLSVALQNLWSDHKGIYLNKNLDTNNFTNRLSPTSFYPMLAGVSTKKQAARMLAEHYYNSDEFYGEYMIPSCPRNDQSYDNNYWRGAIWGPMNFLVYLGLKDYDKHAALELANSSYSMFENAWKDHHYVWENINSSKGPAKEHNGTNSDPFYHWGALMGLMKFMESGNY